MSKNFYQDLPAIAAFEHFTQAEMYQPLPKDWVVIVTDIKNSTVAIENGLYKEVNLIGAASITQTMQSQHTQNIPFVFGGDGASMCIHQDDAEYVSQRLSQLQKLAKDNFNLELRVAVIPLTDIRDSSCDVLVAKLEISKDKFIALFRGGGLAKADVMAKTQYSRYEIKRSTDKLESLQGLSCRWSPVPSRKGKVVSLLVMARDTGAMDVYQTLIGHFREILGRDLSDTNPVQDNLVKYKSPGKALQEESKYHRTWFSVSFLLRSLDIMLTTLIFNFGINPIRPFFNSKAYKESISGHSDYRKFDDTLRLIMDCTETELQNIVAMLDDAYQNGHLYYGVHVSEEALMTCFVESTQQGGHLHFIDGGDGGLAMAARQLKMQIGGA